MKIEHSFSPELVYAELLKSGEAWADADAAATLLEETLRSVRSELKLDSSEKSDAARETEALASPSFKAHVVSMVEARRVANRARVGYDAVRTLADLRRSEHATRRAEAQLAGLQP
jgi:hypothetical protein